MKTIAQRTRAIMTKVRARPDMARAAEPLVDEGVGLRSATASLTSGERPAFVHKMVLDLENR